MIGAFCVYILIQIIGYISWPLIAAALPSAPDRGLGISKAFGLTVVTLIVWMLVRHGPLTFSAFTGVFAILIISASSLSLLKSSKDNLRQILKSHGKLVEILFLGSYLFFLLIRAWNPEIFWGEKPMDSSFLNYFVRIENFPPKDPWAAGNPLHYYYFGYIMWGLVHKFTSLPTGIGYNISFAASASIYVTALFSITYWIIGNTRYAILSTLMIACMSNIDLIWLILGEGKPLTFDTFWASSRTMRSPAFNEYPIWAFIFGDLHAHLMALPVVVTSLCLGVQLTKNGAPLVTPIIAGIFLGSLFGINAWDIFSLAWIGVFLLFITRRPITQLFRDGAIFLVLFIATKQLISLDVSPGLEINWGWVYPNEYSYPSEIFRHFGLFLIPIWIGIFSFVLLSFRPQEWVKATIFFPLLIAPMFITNAHPKAWGTALPALLTASLALSGALHKNIKERLSFAFIFYAIGATAIVALEHVFIMDRMNTIFKLYYGVWLSLGLSAGCMISILFDAMSLRSASSFIRWGGRSFIAAMLIIGFFGTGISIAIMSSFQRIDGPRPTLDGTAFLPRKDGDESALMAWMNQNISGTPVIAEAHGNSYGEYTRISMHTGLPTILGWGYHVTQRGTTSEEVDERKEDLIQIYTSLSAEVARSILAKYGASYVVVGNVERRAYAQNALEKFKLNPSMFEEVFSSGEVKLFKVL